MSLRLHVCACLDMNSQGGLYILKIICIRLIFLTLFNLIKSDNKTLDSSIGFRYHFKTFLFYYLDLEDLTITFKRSLILFKNTLELFKLHMQNVILSCHFTYTSYVRSNLGLPK